MLTKRKILISAILSTLIVTNNISAQELECSDGKCQVNLNNLKKKPNNVNTFKNIQPRFMRSQIKENHNLQVTHEETYVETFDLGGNKYIQQEGEYLEPETEIEKNTIILAPHKYVMNYQEREKHNEQQSKKINFNGKGQDLENQLFEPILPMPLYYCENNTEPVFNLELEQFQCII
jgi:hypothetical protein